MALPAYQARPPLAGKPPFATDEPDSIFADPKPQRRYQHQPKQDPNARTSAYNHYDGYLADEKRTSGMGNLGMALMNGDFDDDDDDETEQDKHAALAAATSPQKMPVPQHPPNVNSMPMPLAAPRPGYAAPIAALRMPNPSPSPDAPYQMPRSPPGLANAGAPRHPPPAALAMAPPRPAPISVPSTPHPLPPTMTPIQPVFARPAKGSLPPVEVKWGPDSIMRGNSEEKLIPRRGEKGDDFWRRFSMIAKEESKKSPSQKESSWLRKTRNGTSRMSRWVWVIGIVLLVCAGLAIGLGIYLSQKSSSHQAPTAIGGSANESLGVATTTTLAKGAKGTAGLSTTPHVSPTFTVARRDASPASPTDSSELIFLNHSDVLPNGSSRRRKRHVHHVSH
ncbi:hypothetical protein FA95DRAFT_1535228 [Auriscalpium vulgare]|uniref:Uncharacterized protein n=1 Tax=Auriscalpium vulgare TaxID=40419 RepID=A0ACB8S4W0_9AGAM|nr:hypothetical protein FA95DRAFT_1535228 [Auriscalpium vulgare]